MGCGAGLAAIIPSDGTFSWRFFFKLLLLLPYGKSFLISNLNLPFSYLRPFLLVIHHPWSALKVGKP